MPTKSTKVNLRDLKKHNPPLAKVVEAVLGGKTARDGGVADIGQDIALALEARKKNSRLSRALDALSKAEEITGRHIRHKADKISKKIASPAPSPKSRKRN